MSHFTDTTKIDTDKYWYDEEAAESAVNYIETECVHPEGPLSGTPLILADWQKNKIIRPLFGWKHKEPTKIKDAKGLTIKEFHKRKFTTLHMEVGKKSGKGTLSSAIIQLMMDIDDTEETMQVAGLAWGREQAKIVWSMVNKSMMASERAKQKFDFYTKSIISKDKKRVYKVWSKESGSNDGQMPSVLLADELHIHKSPDLLDMAEKSTVTRAQPLIMITTTAGDNLEGVGYDRSQYAKKVADGVLVDESMLVCIYCANDDDDPYDEEVWYKSHPMLGVSIPIEEFRKYAEKAKISKYAENSFKRYYLNVWNNNASQWLSDDLWSKSKWDMDKETLKGRLCYGGMDLSSTNDITAFSLVFPLHDDKYASLNWFFLPEEKGDSGIDPKRLMNYYQWVEEGYIVHTPGNTIDRQYVYETIKQACTDYNVQSICYDPLFATDIVAPLHDDGVNMQPHPQNLKHMSFGTKKLEELIQAKRFNHFGNPVLRWMNNCTSVLEHQNAYKPIRIKGGDQRSKKIDGIVSNVMALSYAADPTKKKEHDSYLSDSGGQLFTV